jgi:hypothetical protein
LQLDFLVFLIRIYGIFYAERSENLIISLITHGHLDVETFQTEWGERVATVSLAHIGLRCENTVDNSVLRLHQSAPQFSVVVTG